MARVVPIVVAKPHRQTIAILIKSRRMRIYLLRDFRDQRPRSQPIPMFKAVSTLLSVFGRLHSQHETLSTSAMGTLRVAQALKPCRHQTGCANQGWLGERMPILGPTPFDRMRIEDNSPLAMRHRCILLAIRQTR